MARFSILSEQIFGQTFHGNPGFGEYIHRSLSYISIENSLVSVINNLKGNEPREIFSTQVFDNLKHDLSSFSSSAFSRLDETLSAKFSDKEFDLILLSIFHHSPEYILKLPRIAGRILFGETDLQKASQLLEKYGRTIIQNIGIISNLITRPELQLNLEHIPKEILPVLIKVSAICSKQNFYEILSYCSTSSSIGDLQDYVGVQISLIDTDFGYRYFSQSTDKQKLTNTVSILCNTQTFQKELYEFIYNLPNEAITGFDKSISVLLKNESLSSNIIEMLVQRRLSISRLPLTLNELVSKDDINSLEQLVQSSSEENFDFLNDLKINIRKPRVQQFVEGTIKPLILTGKIDLSRCFKLFDFYTRDDVVNLSEVEILRLKDDFISSKSKMKIPDESKTKPNVNLFSFIISIVKRFKLTNFKIEAKYTPNFEFAKDGSLMYVLLGKLSSLRNMYLIHLYPSIKDGFKIWEELYKKGLPVPAILKSNTGKEKLKINIKIAPKEIGLAAYDDIESFPSIVYGKFEGFTIYHTVSLLPFEWRWSILEQRLDMYIELIKLGIKHNHSHSLNWCIQYIYPNGEIKFDPFEALIEYSKGTNIQPKAILIDWDNAQYK